MFGFTVVDMEPEITEVVLALESAVMDPGHVSVWAGLDPGSIGADHVLVTTGVCLETKFMGASLVLGQSRSLGLQELAWHLEPQEPAWRLALQRLGAFLFHSGPQRIG